MNSALGESGLGEYLIQLGLVDPDLDSDSPDFVDLSTGEYALHLISIADSASKFETLSKKNITHYNGLYHSGAFME